MEGLPKKLLVWDKFLVRFAVYVCLTTTEILCTIFREMMTGLEQERGQPLWTSRSMRSSGN